MNYQGLDRHNPGGKGSGKVLKVFARVAHIFEGVGKHLSEWNNTLNNLYKGRKYDSSQIMFILYVCLKTSNTS